MTRRSRMPIISAAAVAAALVGVGCSDPIVYDFGRCQTREVRMPMKTLSIHECPVEPRTDGVDALRFIQMDVDVANVIALSGKNLVTVVPVSLSRPIIGYGAQKYAKLTVHLAPNVDRAEWKAAGWELNSAGSTGVRAVWTRPG
jgi:hypothetical protein